MFWAPETPLTTGGRMAEADVDDCSQWRIQKILVGGDLKHKTSKIRMSSPKLRVIFRPKSEIQTFFSPKFRWSPKKKKKKKKKRSSPKLRVIFRRIRYV